MLSPGHQHHMVLPALPSPVLLISFAPGNPHLLRAPPNLTQQLSLGDNLLRVLFSCQDPSPVPLITAHQHPCTPAPRTPAPLHRSFPRLQRQELPMPHLIQGAAEAASSSSAAAAQLPARSGGRRSRLGGCHGAWRGAW